MSARLLAAAAWLLASSSAMAACPTETERPGAMISQGLLDPATADADRAALAERLLCSANAGNMMSEDIAGSLYRWGPEHPAHVFPQDLDKARALFTAAANQGWRTAMNKLAELELATGHADEAMLWAQVENVYYLRNHDGKEPPSDGHADYYTMLLKRITDKLGPVDHDALLAKINDRVQSIDMQVAASSRRATASTASTATRTRVNDTHRVGNVSYKERVEGADAQFFAVVGPDGRVRNLWLVDAEPSIDDGTNMGPVVEAMRWNALSAGDTTLRYVMVPVEMKSKTTGVHLR